MGSTSFRSASRRPGIAKEWGVDRAALGIVLSMELIGMAVGSVLLGQLCDRIGRRPTVLGCLVAMAMRHGAGRDRDDVTTLSAYRLLTGLGIGGMLAATNAVVAEFANARRRNLAVAIMAGGYPAGAVLGGTIASALLVGHDWRSVFLFGAVVSALCIPLVWLLLPETVAWLAQRRPANAVERINRTLARMGHDVIDGLPEPEAAAPRSALSALVRARPRAGHAAAHLRLLRPHHDLLFHLEVDAQDRRGHGLCALGRGRRAGVGECRRPDRIDRAEPAHPALRRAPAGDRGDAARDGSGLQRSATRRRISATLGLLAALAGSCTNGAIVGLYAMFAQSFPTAVRAGGTGFVIGVGRGGAALGPILAGYLFAADLPLSVVALVMALGSLVGALALFVLRYDERRGA